MDVLINRFRHYSLTKKLLILASVLGIAVSVVGTSIHLYILKQNFKRELLSDLQLAVSLSRPSLESAIHKNDLKQINQIIHNLNQQTFICNASVTFDQAEIADTFATSRCIKTQNDATPYVVTVREKIGRAELIVTGKHYFLEHQSGYYIGSIFIVDIFHVVFICAGMLFFFRKLIFRHLRHIAAFARQTSVHNLDEKLSLTRAPRLHSEDELDHVVKAIEQMRKQVIEDVDERRAIELALIAEKQEKLEAIRLTEDAQASDQAKSQFIATMSHEIRTPMNGVLGMVEMLRGTTLNTDQQQYVDIIFRSGEALMGIINDILDYSKIEAGKMTLEHIDFDLEELINDCMQLFGGAAHKKRINLLGDIAPGTPKRIYGDPSRLRQILVNLIGNAFKFTEKGDIFIEVSSEVKLENETCSLTFSVHDSGIGIKPEVQKSIFSPFLQADNTTSRKYGGTGLGLAICAQIVELMKGKIGVESNLGKGSRFWFSYNTNYKPSESSESCSLALSEKNALFVGASPVAERTFIQHAKTYNLNIQTSHSGQETLDLLNESQDTPFDFILLSLNIHGTNALALSKEIWTIPGYENTPIIMLTNKQNASFDLNALTPISSLLKQPLCISHIFNSFMSEMSGVSLNELIPNQKPNRIEGGAPLKVLVAEDNVVNRMVIEGLLEKINIKPDFSENGIEVVEQYCSQNNKYDLIFMDCEMPEMDGFDATINIRKWESNQGIANIPIIALTAHVEAEHRKRVIDVGMNYYLAKPITIERISEALKSIGLL